MKILLVFLVVAVINLISFGESQGGGLLGLGNTVNGLTGSLLGGGSNSGENTGNGGDNGGLVGGLVNGLAGNNSLIDGLLGENGLLGGGGGLLGALGPILLAPLGHLLQSVLKVVVEFLQTLGEALIKVVNGLDTTSPSGTSTPA